MKAWNLKLIVMLTLLLVGAIAVAGETNQGESRDVSMQNCGPAMCPKGCCTEETFVPNVTISWEKSHWQEVQYDQQGHLLNEMTELQAMNIARQYLEMYHYEAILKSAEGDRDSYKFEVINSIFKGKMLEINRKNGWVRQYDSC